MDAVHARTHAHRKQTQKLNQHLGLQLWTSIITLLLFYLNININSCDRMMVASLSLYTLLWTFSASSAVTIHCSRICSFFLPNIPIFATYLSLKLAQCQVVFLLSLMILHWVVVIYRELRSCNKQRWRQHKKSVSSIRANNRCCHSHTSVEFAHKKNTQSCLAPDLVYYYGNRNTCREIWASPATLSEVLLPFTSWGPLLAPHCPNCPSSTGGLTPIRASDMGLYWLLLDRPSQVSLFILAALPPSQEDNLLWLPFISHVPALRLFSSHSLCLYLRPCFVDFHFTPLCCRMTRPPPQHPRVLFLSVILSSALSAVWEKRSWIDLGFISATVSQCVLLYRHSSASCLFTLACQLGPHSQYGRWHEMRSVTPSAYWRYRSFSNPPSLTSAVFQPLIIRH